MTKRCAACAHEKPTTAFSKARNRADGLYNYCKDCAGAKSQRYYQEHREKCLAYTAQQRTLPRVAERRRAWAKKDYAKNRAKHLASASAWSRNNRKRRRAYITQWNDDNREKVRHYQNEYKARRRANGGKLTAHGWRLLRDIFRQKCVYCGKHKPLEQDHVVALRRGGAHALHNIVPACRNCNAKKATNSLPLWWAA